MWLGCSFQNINWRRMDYVTRQLNDGNVPQTAIVWSGTGPDICVTFRDGGERRDVDKSSVSQRSLRQPTLLTNRPLETRNNTKSFPSALIFSSPLWCCFCSVCLLCVGTVLSLSRDRRSAPGMASAESRAEDNPYDYRHLLRKTSQRRKLIKHYWTRDRSPADAWPAPQFQPAVMEIKPALWMSH